MLLLDVSVCIFAIREDSCPNHATYRTWLTRLLTGDGRPLLFYRGDYTGIEPEKTTPAHWRDDLEAFLITTTQDTWL
ncbi:flavin-dependent monooxygenase, reductase subunit [Mycobacterium tuberculosis]|nr:flavin-dependent monooxygenase, reductase subunit [Mycobacterium tuberculosis]